MSVMTRGLGLGLAPRPPGRSAAGGDVLGPGQRVGPGDDRAIDTEDEPVPAGHLP